MSSIRSCSDGLFRWNGELSGQIVQMFYVLMSYDIMLCDEEGGL